MIKGICAMCGKKRIIFDRVKTVYEHCCRKCRSELIRLR